MKKHFLILLLFISGLAVGQNANRQYLSHSWKNKILTVKTSDGDYAIKSYTDKIFETTFIPKDETFNPESHAVVMPPNVALAKFSQTGNLLKLDTGEIQVVIQKSPFKISYNYNGNEILSEKNGFTQKDSTQTIDFNIDATEALYGGGSRALGLNRRGNLLKLYNRAQYGYGDRAELLNFCIPLVLSSKIYAVHFDNAAIGSLDLDSKKNNTLTYETISGRKTYQVIAGDNWEELTRLYTQLTGRQPLPPRWAFGNFSSRFGYKSQADVEKTIKKFEDDKIPVDAIILDLYWFGKTVQGTLGNLEWDKETFPNPEKMIADLNKKGIKTILITEPFILTTSSKWQEAVDKKVLAVGKDGNPFQYDFYFGNTGIVDIFKPEGKTWFWNIYKNLVNQGVGGWWGDLGEPEAFPSKAITAKGTADEVHNIYGHNWAKLLADGYKKDFPNVRPFILMRAGYSGSQRYGMIPWSGDVSRSWAGLQSQPEIALEMGMQGIAYMHSDLGGFAGDYFDNELYLRWLQYGVFQPIFRPHASDDVAPEPVYKDIVTKEKAKKQVELRYQLLPYNYNIAFENTRLGTPLMRPLIFEEPDNPALFNYTQSYLWGNSFLVTPILKPGITSTAVYFPKGNNWFDFYSDEKHVGGKTENVAVTEDHIPVFVRGGDFIPMIKPIPNTSKYSLADFDLHFYYDPESAQSSGALYNDDGAMPDAYEKGAYENIGFSSSVTGKMIAVKLTASPKKDHYTVSDKNITLVIHNFSTPKKVTVDGKIVTFKTTKNALEIPVLLEKGTTRQIKIEL
ncbi:MAG TPA: TIM-barrel domain-containing protein [Flavobacterium sp.]|nr:TIM-barrel domain-containing protein [Flavobacterium sp.]